MAICPCLHPDGQAEELAGLDEVERRKLEKRYVEFIKTSQPFNKEYIQRLASHFKGMKGDPGKGHDGCWKFTSKMNESPIPSRGV
jgi:hypothetical protein